MDSDASVVSVSWGPRVSESNSHFLVMDLSAHPDPQSLPVPAFPAALWVPIRPSAWGTRTQRQGAGKSHVHWPVFSVWGGAPRVWDSSRKEVGCLDGEGALVTPHLSNPQGATGSGRGGDTLAKVAALPRTREALGPSPLPHSFPPATPGRNHDTRPSAMSRPNCCIP